MRINLNVLLYIRFFFYDQRHASNEKHDHLRARARGGFQNENASIRMDFEEKDRTNQQRTNQFSIEPPVRDSCDPFFRIFLFVFPPLSFLFPPLFLYSPCFAQLHNPFEHKRQRTKEEKLNGRDEDKRGAEKRRRMNDREYGRNKEK